MSGVRSSDELALPLGELLERIGSSASGLTSQAADERRHLLPKEVRRPEWLHALWVLAAQFRSPITLILIGTALLSLVLRDLADASVILTIVFCSAGLSFWQEYRTDRALAALLELVKTRATVLRDGVEVEIPAHDVLPGDVQVLSAGSAIAGDARLLEAKDLFVNEATLTGETFPVEKTPGELPAPTSLTRRTNVMWQGTHVVSGTACAVVIHTGDATQLGRIRQRLQSPLDETEFEHGVRQFGSFLLEITLLLVLSILGVHLVLRHPPLESFLFALALAVGLTPQLLPAIISVNLAHGAQRLAQMQCIVRRLTSIENFGSMDVLCTDKTGTLTTGSVRIHQAVDVRGDDSPTALRLAWLNARFETGFVNPTDEALRQQCSFGPNRVEKLDEIPYDFLRKRLSVLVRDGDRRLLIVKGAASTMLPICSKAQTQSGELLSIDDVRFQLDAQFQQFGEQGYRLLAVAYREVEQDRVAHRDEAELVFAGWLLFEDPPKPDIEQTLARLHELGVELKMITGDNRVVAASIAQRVGIDASRQLTGEALRQLSDDALSQQASKISVYSEIDPQQKERIIRALRRAGHVVGYLGDGINDAAALRAADVGVSVDDAVDVAREAADIVLLRKDIGVLIDGVRAGRETFINTLKYVFLATSANFGNMFSMAGASLFLPFLPLLPKQVLLTNLLTDLPEMAIAGDRVDEQQIARPRRWSSRDIQRFMLVFGLLSSAFDFATFAILLHVMHAGPEEFRSGWFVESIVSACFIVLVIRTRQAFWKSRPSTPLLLATVGVILSAIALPYTPLGGYLGFEPLPATFLAAMLTIVAAYAASAEFVKHWFYRDTHPPRS